VGESSPNPVTFVGKLVIHKSRLPPEDCRWLASLGRRDQHAERSDHDFHRKLREYGRWKSILHQQPTVTRAASTMKTERIGDIVATSGSLWILGFKPKTSRCQRFMHPARSG